MKCMLGQLQLRQFCNIYTCTSHHPCRRRRAPQAATAALLLGAPLTPAALAGEFDLLAEGTPSTYVLDDAGILNKTTKKSVGDQLKALEVRGRTKGLSVEDMAVCGAHG